MRYCFVCQRDTPILHESDSTLTTVGMVDGTFFRATGNYGSGVYDPADYQAIEIVICDQCVLDRIPLIVHLTDEGQFPFDRHNSREKRGKRPKLR